ncbi:MAG: MBL fold metallo-hydrolase [Actinomycetota bacterium]
MELEVVVTPSLGDNSYLVASGGAAALVDPQRDIGRYLEPAEARGLAIRYALETHLHNDYVSGAIELRAATGAEIVAPARGGYEFPVRPMAEGDEIRVGDVRLVALETPGHTPEHISYLLYGEGSDAPNAVFTGGSLMVGGAGRTDLLGEEFTDELARAQYRTLRRFAALPDAVQVLPTHGPGSFCGVGPAPKERTSTIADERRGNRALAAPDEEAYVEQQLGGLVSYPDYYRYIAPINRAGPRVLGEVQRPQPLWSGDVSRRIEEGAWVIDGRPREAFAEAHVPESLNVELDDGFATYVGWVVPFNAPLVLLVPQPEGASLEEAVVQLLRIGYERIEGYLAGGMEAWRADGRQVRSFGASKIEELCEAYREGRLPPVLDVRQQREWDAGHIPGSRHIFVGDLRDRLGEVPRHREIWTACSTGHRAAIAASLLDRSGAAVRLVSRGGIPDLLATCAPQGESVAER